MSCLGLFGHDQNPGGTSSRLPQAPPPPALTTAAPAAPNGLAALPPAPPSARKAPSAFDDDHYRQTMLALASGFFSGNGLGEGLSNAARVIAGQNAAIRQEGRPALGGPDNAFEVYTDPQTGERSYKPVEAFQDYLKGKRTKPTITADLQGRLMAGIMKLKPEEREAAFQGVRSNPTFYGVDASSLPETWSDQYGTIAGNMGMTVAQGLTQERGDQKAKDAEEHRDAADKDRTRRTDLQERRVNIQETQGNARLSQGERRIAQGAGRLDLARQNTNAKNPPRVASQADWAALPKGATYIAPDGTRRTKK